MDKDDPHELHTLRRAVRQLVADWRAAGRYQPRCDAWMRGFDEEFSRAIAARGWIGMPWPRDVGGRGASYLARLGVTEELLRAGAPVAAHWMGDRQIGPGILRYGSTELQKEFLPRIAAAEVVFCLGMSEPEAGSDLAAVRTSAQRVGGDWRISGRKIWTSHAHRATHAYVLARTERTARRHEGLTEFVLDMRSPGVTVSPIVDLSGEHHFNEVTFDEVVVPGRWVIGEVGAGWRQVTEQLAFERGGAERYLSTYPLLEQLIQAQARPPAGGDAAPAELGRLVARLAGLRRLCRQIALAMDAGRAPVAEAATLKYLGTAFEEAVVEAARRLLPWPDPAPGHHLGQAVLAAPGFGIRGGATDVLGSLLTRQETRKRTGR